MLPRIIAWGRGVVDDSHFEAIRERLEGKTVVLACDDHDTGKVLLSE